MCDKSLFDLFDAKGEGSLSEKELGLCLAAHRCVVTQKDLAAWAASCPNGKCDWQTFQGIVAQLPRADADASTEQQLLEAFKVFDKNEDGLIPENDLRVIFTTLGEGMDTFDVNHTLCQVKVDGNGKVNYKEFVKYILAK